MNLASSGNQKQQKLALDLLDLSMVETITVPETDTLEPDCFDKISVDRDQNKEKTLGNNEESDMDWTTVRAKNKRNRSGSNDTEQINIATNVSPNKKRKSDKKSNSQSENKETGNHNKGQNQPKPKSETKKHGNDNNAKPAVNKDSVLVVVTDIPENTYFNSIKMETMILRAFPRLKETGMWAKYKVNKRHEGKCYVTLPKDHFNDNVTEIINSFRF